ncbi:MAG: hypothetical protein KAR07_12605 [Spirochaetes bacterium]|nr:hypothetical protein [Spirochaetota bacterium]MCK5269012.1 hypothetical protein [Spirochaetota bacterium]
MTISEVCLIIITSILFLKGLVGIIIAVSAWRIFNKKITPLIDKSDGILDSLSSVAETAKEEIEELKTAVDDITYNAREVTGEVRDKILPSLSDLAGSISGIARVISFFFSRKSGK